MEMVKPIGTIIDKLVVNNETSYTIVGYKVIITEGGKQRVAFLSDRDFFHPKVQELILKSMPCEVVERPSSILTSHGQIKQINKKYYALNKAGIVVLDAMAYLRLAQKNPTIATFSTDTLNIKAEIVDRIRKENTLYYNLMQEEKVPVNVNPNIVNQAKPQVQPQIQPQVQPQVQPKVEEPMVEVAPKVEEPKVESKVEPQAQVQVPAEIQAEHKVEPQAPVEPKMEPKAEPVKEQSQKVHPLLRTDDRVNRVYSTIDPSLLLPIPDADGLYYGETEKEYTYKYLITKFLNSAIFEIEYEEGEAVANSKNEDESYMNVEASNEACVKQARLDNTNKAVKVALQLGETHEIIYNKIVDAHTNGKPLILGGLIIDPASGKFLKSVDDFKKPQVQVPTNQVNIPTPVQSQLNTQAPQQTLPQSNPNGTMTVSNLLKYIKYKNVVIGYLMHIKGTIMTKDKKVPLDNTIGVTLESLASYSKALPGFTKVVNGTLLVDQTNPKATITLTAKQASDLSPNPLNRAISPLDLFDVITNEDGTTQLKSKYSELTKRDTDLFKTLATKELTEAPPTKMEEAALDTATPERQVEPTQDAPVVTPQVAPAVPTIAPTAPVEKPVEVQVEAHQEKPQEQSANQVEHIIDDNTKFIGYFEQDNETFVVYTNDFNVFTKIPCKELVNKKSQSITLVSNKLLIEFANKSVKVIKKE